MYIGYIESDFVLDAKNSAVFIYATLISSGEGAAILFKEIAELLISKEAYVNARDKSGDTPLQWASNQGQTAVVELLKKHGASE